MEIVQVVGVGVHQDGNLKPAKPQRISHPSLIAEVGQRNEYSVDAARVGMEQVSAPFCIMVGLDAPQLRLFRIENDGLDVHALEQGEKSFAGLADQNVREKVTITNDYC